MASNTILIVDDEEDIRTLMSDILSDENFNCITAKNSDEAFEAISKNIPTIVLLDIWLQGSNLDGLGILETLRAKHPSIPVIMISGHGTIETAVNSIKLGAYDYIEKPFSADKLIITIKRTCETIRLKKENIGLKKKIAKKVELTGKSEAITNLRAMIDKVAPTSSRILIEGESGSGRELVAKLIHRKSNRSNYSFVKLNSSILLNDNLQKELFGSGDSFGLVDLANHGTLFISEVSDLPLYAQHKILTIIKSQDPDKTEGKNFDIRIIASTSKDLKKEVKSGNFLQDLYYRLNSISISIPGLNDRKEDIAELCEHFMKHFERNSNLKRCDISNKVIEALKNYDWSGSVRQLKNLVEWLMISAQIENSSIITTSMLPHHILNQAGSVNIIDSDVDIMSMPLREAREIFEKKYLTAQMIKFNNNISKTSLFVGMERSALHRKLKLLDIHSSEPKVKVDAEYNMVAEEKLEA